jgi:integrase
MFMELFRGEGRKTWQLRFTDNTGTRRQLSTRSQERSTALTIAHKIERLVEAKRRGDTLTADLSQWIAASHKDVRDKLQDWGIVDNRDAVQSVPLSQWLDQWKAHLLSDGNTAEYAAAAWRKVRDTLEGVAMPSDITALTVDGAIKRLRKYGVKQPDTSKRQRKPYSPQSCNDCLSKTKQFTAWLVRQCALRESPLAGMKGFTREVVNANRVHPRGVLSVDQQRALIASTAASTAMRMGMTGQQRADLYRIVLHTGLRAFEAANLTVHWFDLNARTLTIPPTVTKTSREDVLYLREDLLPVIARSIEAKLPDARLFPRVHEDSLVDMLRDDLRAAGVPDVTPSGKFIDFHSLRHTYGTEMAKVCKASTLQQLMRHKSVQTTLKYYVHPDFLDVAGAVDLAPALDTVQRSVQRAG